MQQMHVEFLLVPWSSVRPRRTGHRCTLAGRTARMAKKHCMTSFFCPAWVPHCPVWTGRITKNTPVYPGRAPGPCVQAGRPASAHLALHHAMGR